MGEAGCCSSSSSGEEDGDAEWRAAIDSIATDANNQSAATNGPVQKISNRTSNSEEQLKHKLYVVKIQKLLEDMLDKSLEMVHEPIPVCDDEPEVNEGGGIRLFRHAPPGIVFDPVDKSQLPRKRPKIIHGYEVDEKSKRFKRQLKSVAVDGVEIMASARDACKKSLARYESKDAAAKAKAKREEERVAELKKIRGEKWLPSIARHMRNIPSGCICTGLMMILCKILDGICFFVSIRWALQEERFSAIFDTLSSVANAVASVFVARFLERVGRR